MERKEKNFVFEDGNGKYETDFAGVVSMAEAGNIDGMYALGMSLVLGFDTDPDEEKGYGYLEKAAEAGQYDAMLFLVRMYFAGHYSMETEKAVEYATSASEAGLPEAKLYLGTAFMDGLTGERDYAEAARLFRQAANAGIQEARNSLAYLYEEGLGVPKDESKAFRLYLIAAKAGNINAMFRCGVCLEFGIGTDTDVKSATEWYEKGAAQGDAFAMHRLGVLYSSGSHGLPEDPHKAFGWFLSAAMNGIGDSMYAVSICYRDGYGTERDGLESKRWLNLAKDSGAEIPED